MARLKREGGFPSEKPPCPPSILGGIRLYFRINILLVAWNLLASIL
jgi:hypothetical protein